MALGRLAPRAIASGGNVVVLGNDTCGPRPHVDYPGQRSYAECEDRCVRDDSVALEIWDRQSDHWLSLGGIGKPRADFAAVPLADGRLLVTGGVNAGATDETGHQSGHDSFSSTYVSKGGFSSDWSKVAPLATARTSPAATTLSDGRVLVAGGYYIRGNDIWGSAEPAHAVALVGYRGGQGDRRDGPVAPPFDVDPGPPPALALATVELYDPTTEAWSATGSLHFARYGAPTVTLSDGRVLVAGSNRSGYVWDGRFVKIDDSAPYTSEIFDPASGRFSLTDRFPAVDWAALVGDDFETRVISVGSLVALQDGGALLVGRTEDSGSGAFAIRSLRFHPGTETWSEIDRVLYAPPPRTAGMVEEVASGHSRMDMLAATTGGRVLLAGGASLTGAQSYEVSADAVLFDPATDEWTVLPPMPEPRAGGAAVTLPDGAVLLVGGYNDAMPQNGELCTWGATGLTSAILFEPAAPESEIP